MIDLYVRQGIIDTKTDVFKGSINPTLLEIKQNSDLYCSTHIEEMAANYDAYVLNPFSGTILQSHQHNIHTQLQIKCFDKQPATSVVGNIGECVFSSISQQLLIDKSDVKHFVCVRAETSRKQPDYLVKVGKQGMSFLGLSKQTACFRWPAESKASNTAKNAQSAVKKALLQIGAYWYDRHVLCKGGDISVGYGIISSLIYKSVRSTVKAKLIMHVIVPSDIKLLTDRISHYSSLPSGVLGFLSELKRRRSPSRSALSNV